jgi:hypothetical protein
MTEPLVQHYFNGYIMLPPGADTPTGTSQVEITLADGSSWINPTVIDWLDFDPVAALDAIALILANDSDWDCETVEAVSKVFDDRFGSARCLGRLGRLGACGQFVMPGKKLCPDCEVALELYIDRVGFNPND